MFPQLYPPLHFLVYIERGQERTTSPLPPTLCPEQSPISGADEKEVGSLIINPLKLHPPRHPPLPSPHAPDLPPTLPVVRQCGLDGKEPMGTTDPVPSFCHFLPV